MLTTIDNPFDPITQWEDWYAYDLQNGHNTCAYIARIMETRTPSGVEELDDIETDIVINEIVRMFPEKYKIV